MSCFCLVRLTDKQALLTLLCLSALLKLIVLLQQPILARDGIHYIRFAEGLSQRDWPAVLREEPYHPGYPLVIAGFAEAYQLFHTSALTPVEWQWCAHLAAALAGVLLVVPLFGLIRCFFSTNLAWISVALFLILPATVQITTDALAESWLLVFLFAALWCLVLAVQKQQGAWFAMAGLFAGFGYLVRLEALMVPAAGLMVLGTRRWWSGSAMSWQWALRSSGVLVGCFLITAAPYMLTIGKFSPRPSAGQVLQVWNAESGSIAIADPHYLFASRLQDGVNGLRIETLQLLDAIKLVGTSLIKAGHYLVWPFAILGLFVLWRLRQIDLGNAVIWCVAIVNLLILLRLGYAAGYSSERHGLLLVALACMPACIGLCYLHTKMGSKSCVTIALMLGCAALCLPKALQPLHHSQEGHRQAGFWLANHLNDNDVLIDPYHWASFYAGRETNSKVLSPSTEQWTFAVIDPHDADLNRREEWKKAGVLQENAPILFSWPSQQHPRLLIRQSAPRQSEK